MSTVEIFYIPQNWKRILLSARQTQEYPQTTLTQSKMYSTENCTLSSVIFCWGIEGKITPVNGIKDVLNPLHVEVIVY